MFWLDALEFKLQDKFYLVNTIFFHTQLGVANLCSDTKQQVTHAWGDRNVPVPPESPAGSTMVKPVTRSAQELPDRLHFFF